MIVSTLAAAVLATQPPAAAMPMPMAQAPAATAAKPAKPAMAMGKMDCCKDGCSCCGGKKDAAKR